MTYGHQTFCSILTGISVFDSAGSLEERKSKYNDGIFHLPEFLFAGYTRTRWEGGCCDRRARRHWQRQAKITAQLLLHGIEKVIVVARSEDKFNIARKEWICRDGITLSDDSVQVEFVQADLGDVESVRTACEHIKAKTDLIHILICNAGLGVPYECQRSPQNIDHVFAANCVGHQVLTTVLLPLLKNAASIAPNGARVVVTTSSLHLICRRLDCDLLTSPTRIKWPALYDGMWRYGRSKLGNILFAKELSRRLLEDQDPPSKQIYVNSYFPGNIVTAQWLAWSSYFGAWIGLLMRMIGSRLGQTAEDGAATAIYLAASAEVKDMNFRGEYFIPIATSSDPSPMGKDMYLGQQLWEWIDTHVTKILGPNWKN
ncbi:hypothetical protein N7462_009903, partial [Penicillium macrosclerotiorum]|uniref:uncharacterized protein n=1 Tax=Penicillium macrosclerotiorum TaxID=303699 RepID=UPI0025466B97